MSKDKYFHIKMADGRSQQVLFRKDGNDGCKWNKPPKEFGAPYRLHFVDDEGQTVRYGVGMFLPDNGGGWHFWGSPESYKPLHFVTYDPTPLHYAGWPRQNFQHYLTAKPVTVNLPARYITPVIPNFKNQDSGILFGTSEAIGAVGTSFKVKNPLLTKYSELIPMGEDTYKVECPMCKDGVLLLRRHPEKMHLLADDNCVSCGQAVHFIDLGSIDLGSKDIT